MAQIIYLPIYVLSTCGQAYCEYSYLYGINHKSKDYEDKIVICFVSFNIVKLILTSALLIASCRFASQLNKIIAENRRVFGETDPHVLKSEVTFWFVKRLVIAYMIGSILCNLLRPIVLISVDKHDRDGLDPFTFAKSWFMVINSIYMIQVCSQQLLILHFYNRVDKNR